MNNLAPIAQSLATIDTAQSRTHSHHEHTPSHSRTACRSWYSTIPRTTSKTGHLRPVHAMPTSRHCRTGQLAGVCCSQDDAITLRVRVMDVLVVPDEV